MCPYQRNAGAPSVIWQGRSVLSTTLADSPEPETVATGVRVFVDGIGGRPADRDGVPPVGAPDALGGILGLAEIPSPLSPLAVRVVSGHIIKPERVRFPFIPRRSKLAHEKRRHARRPKPGRILQRSTFHGDLPAQPGLEETCGAKQRDDKNIAAACFHRRKSRKSNLAECSSLE
jgi:hypothetical protein